MRSGRKTRSQITINRSDLGKKEWKYSLSIHYLVELICLPLCCDICGKISISNVLECKKGSLITTCYNKLHGAVLNMVRKAYTHTFVCRDLLIQTHHITQGQKSFLESRQREGHTPQPTTITPLRRPQERRGDLSSGTYGKRVPAVSTTCML